MKDELIRAMSSEYTVYLRDESRTVGQAQSISFPKDEGELLSVLQYAYDAGLLITVQGARTGLAAAAVPGGGHVINLMRMNRVLGMRKNAQGQFLLRVQPGVVLTQLRRMIESRQFDMAGWDDASREAYEAFRDGPAFFFTTDPTEATATIGGMAACNASGAMSYFYGPIRKHIHGLRVLLCDGDTLTLRRGETRAVRRHMELRTDSGRVMSFDLPAYQMPGTKNASGYYIEDDMDAVDLFIGSDGTLGVISEIELALTRLPGTIWSVTCFFAREEQALDFVIAARSGLKQAAALEYFDKNALQILRDQKQNRTAFAQLPEIGPQFGCAISLELHCKNEQEAYRRLFEAGEMMKEAGASESDTWVARTAFDRDKLLFFRHAVPESVNMMIDERKKKSPTITKLGTDMAVPDDCLRDIMAMYHAMLAEENLEYAIWGHIGDNHLHVNILPRDAEDQAKGKALYKQWADTVTKLGGSVSAEHGVGKIKAEYLAVMYGERHISEMAALKRVFDPKGLLGAGNLFVPESGGVAV